jgi:hypothetical protein
MSPLGAANVYRLAQKLLETHVLLPIPYLRVAEAHRAHELLLPQRYSWASEDALAFSPAPSS